MKNKGVTQNYEMNAQDSISDNSKDFPLFKGLISRREFVLSYIVCSIIFFVALVASPKGDLGLLFIVSTVYLILQVSLIVQRLHDLGRPGYHWLLVYIPIYGLIFFLFDLCGKKGQLEANKKGVKDLKGKKR